MIFLGLRYLLSKPKQTVLMLLGIFFGTAAYVCISGFMLGFREYLVDQLVNNSAHIHIQAREDFLEESSLNVPFYKGLYQHVFWDPPPSGRKDSAMVDSPQGWYERLKADPRVVAYSPQLSASVVFANGKATAPASITGCDPVQQVKVTNIGDYIIEGKFSDIEAGGNRLVIGLELKKKLGVRLGQNVVVSAANGSTAPFKIVGVFSTGNKLTDIGSYGSIGDVQKINHTPNQVNEIAVKISDHMQAADIANTWAKIFPEKIQSWDQVNASFFDIFKIQDAIRFLSIGSIMVVAAFGIYNVLNMTVMQKRKDIAILKSMGFSTFEIVSLFFSQGFILGVTGASLGIAFGYSFCLFLQTLPFAGGPMGAGSGHLMISLNPKIYIQASTLALLSAMVASILPAYSAGKLTPIEIIRAGTE